MHCNFRCVIYLNYTTYEGIHPLKSVVGTSQASVQGEIFVWLLSLFLGGQEEVFINQVFLQEVGSGNLGHALKKMEITPFYFIFLSSKKSFIKKGPKRVWQLSPN